LYGKNVGRIDIWTREVEVIDREVSMRLYRESETSG
jgi:hypothetical protein